MVVSKSKESVALSTKWDNKVKHWSKLTCQFSNYNEKFCCKVHYWN